MSESINDAGFGGVVGRHLHFHPVPDCKANKPLAHLSGNVRENEMIVRKRNAKHGTREHRCDHPLQLDRFFRIHYFNFGDATDSACPKRFSGAPAAQINSGSSGDCRRTDASRRKDVDALRADALR